MGAAKVSADAVSQFLRAEQAGGFDDCPFAMDPLGLDRVEPWTLDRQIAGQDAHALSALFDLPIVGAHPGPHPLLTCQEALSQINAHRHAHTRTPASCKRAAPGQELLGDGAHRAAIHEAQPDRSARVRAGAAARRSRPAPSGRDRPWRPSAPPAAAAGRGSAQVCRRGWAKRLHQTSSSKPSAQSGCCSARRIRRSRRLFFGHTPGRGW